MTPFCQACTNAGVDLWGPQSTYGVERNRGSVSAPSAPIESVAMSKQTLPVMIS
jgi:hypothetical protein